MMTVEQLRTLCGANIIAVFETNKSILFKRDDQFFTLNDDRMDSVESITFGRDGFWAISPENGSSFFQYPPSRREMISLVSYLNNVTI